MNFLGFALLIAGWIDDSSTMILDEHGKRQTTLITLMTQISEICSKVNESNAPAVRFLNTGEPEMEENENWERYLGERHKFGGVTRIGTELKRQILDGFVNKKTDQNKPLRVLVFTDGAVYISPDISKAI